jgi:hypothetical protein
MPTLYNIPLCGLLILVLLAFIGYHLKPKFDVALLHPDANGKIKGAYVWLTFIYKIAGTFFALIILVIGYNAPIYNKYKEQYNWLDPSKHFDFLFDQIKLQKAQIRPVNCNLDTTNMQGRFYNLIVADWTSSTVNPFAQQLSNRLKASIDSAQEALQPDKNYASSSPIQEKLPLLLVSSLLFTHKDINEHVDCFAYIGDSIYNDMYRERWYNSQDGNVNNKAADNMFHTDLYKNFVTECHGLLRSHLAELQKTDSRERERTDFSFLVKEILDKISDAENLHGYNERDENNYLCITIISDFFHEETFGRHQTVPFNQVESQINTLLAKKSIQQINLLRMPTKKNDTSTINSINNLLKCFKKENIKFSLIDACDNSFCSNGNAIKEIQAATANYEVGTTSPHLNLYASASQNSGYPAFGKLRISTLRPDGEALQFRLRSEKNTNPDIRLEISIPSSDHTEDIKMGTWSSHLIHPTDTVDCKLIATENDLKDHLYLDVYSSKTNIKKTILLTTQPFLDIDICEL